MVQTYIIFCALFILLSGLYIYQSTKREGMTNGTSTEMRCPNLLIQRGPKYFLYNTDLVEVPGVNPIEFNTLDEYVQFLEWQRGAGIRCPVLYLQQAYDAQGKKTYKVRPSVTELQGGLPSVTTKLVDASHDDNDYNKGSFPGYDPTSYYVGEVTPLDEMNEPQNMSTLDAMNPNWKGPQV
jgi:hypothetical protein